MGGPGVRRRAPPPRADRPPARRARPDRLHQPAGRPGPDRRPRLPTARRRGRHRSRLGRDRRGPTATTPTADDLERVAPGRRLYLSRVDGHSAIVSHALLAETPQARAQDGWSDDGRLQRRAKHTVSDRLSDLVGPEQRLSAARQAVAALAARGIGGFHENAAPHIGPDYEVALVRRAAAEAGLHATLYWGELGAFDRVAELGVSGLAGDLVADGAVGSRTASMREEYADQERPLRPRLPRRRPDRRARRRLHPARGPGRLPLHRRRRPRRRGRGLRRGRPAARRRRAAAARAPARALRDALGRGRRALRPARRHRQRPADVRRAVGRSRRDVRRAAGGAVARHEPVPRPRTRPASGSPSARTPRSPPADPWCAVQAAVHHHTDGQGLDPAAAFRAHTRGGWSAARVDGGLLRPGAAATYAVWDAPAGLDADGLPDLTPAPPCPPACGPSSTAAPSTTPRTPT